MNQLDLFYRAFVEYRKLTVNDGECVKQRNIISHSNPDSDKLESTKFVCIINEDWVNEIEQGLVYVEKAINEQRQFIRNDGEVVPIEKVKHVDKHSVEHLAKHSDYISRIPEDGSDIIPEKLYMLERDSDFAVYENRFLYMLLRYLEDFIDMRISRINELGNTYRASTQMKKEISLGKRTISFETTLSEERRNDPYSFLDDEAKNLIARIEGIEHWVGSLMDTPLMEQVAKVPMVRPPITKTNVLRMNNNFKRAVALYEYVASYEGDGYTVEEKTKIYNPFNDAMGDEFSEIVLLSSFLTYMYGNDLKEELKLAYEAEEERRRQQKQDKLQAQIAALKKRIAESGESPEEYMLMLERRNKSLESDSIELREKIEENRKLAEDMNRLDSQLGVAEDKISELLVSISDKNSEIETLNRKYQADMAAKNAEFEERKTELERDYSQKAEQNQADAAKKRAELEEEFKRKSEETRLEADAKVQGIQEDAERRIQGYKDDTERLSQENTLIKAQLNGLRAKNGLTGDIGDLTSKERFEELEDQLHAFVGLFEDEWKKTRKKIRKDILWTIENTGKKDNNVSGKEDKQ